MRYEPVHTITLYQLSGEYNPKVIVEIPVTSNSSYVWKLMSEHQLELTFWLETPTALSRGCRTVYNGMTYLLTEPYTPEYDDKTGTYKYSIKLEAFYYQWKNFIFKYRPVKFISGYAEAEWSLTAPLPILADILLRNLEAEWLIDDFYPFLHPDTDGTYDYGCQLVRIEISIDDENLKTTSKLIKFSQNTIFDALDMIADSWECDWWWTIHTDPGAVLEDGYEIKDRYVLHFGKLENLSKKTAKRTTLFDSATSQNITPNAISIKQASSKSEGYFNRIYVFGSSRNLPSKYPRKSEEIKSGDMLLSTVDKRLMVRKEVVRPVKNEQGNTDYVHYYEPQYIDIYKYLNGKKVYIGSSEYDSPDAKTMPCEEVVEKILTNDDIYPSRVYVVADVQTTTVTDTDIDETGKETKTEAEVYHVLLYYYDVNGKYHHANFRKSYILPNGDPLQLVFQSAPENEKIAQGQEIGSNVHPKNLLNGMTFEVAFNTLYKNPETEMSAQYFEIVRNEDYGIMLPNTTLRPKVGDRCALVNFDCTAIDSDDNAKGDTGLGMLQEAEQKLLAWGIKQAKDAAEDDKQYDVTLTPYAALGIISDDDQTPNEQRAIELTQGDAVTLKSNDMVYREGMVIGIKYGLDMPYDNPIYTIGKSKRRSSLKAMRYDLDKMTRDSLTSAQVSTSIGRMEKRINNTIYPINQKISSTQLSIAELKPQISDINTRFEENRMTPQEVSAICKKIFNT